MGRTLTCKKEEELRSNPGKASLIERLRESVCESELSKTNILTTQNTKNPPKPTFRCLLNTPSTFLKPVTL